MNEINTVIQNIMDNIERKNVQSLCKKILKKCSFKSSKDLSNLTELSTWLYIYGYYDEAIKTSELIKDVTFNGNYTLWDNIDILYCIKARILREQGFTTEVKNIIDFVNQYRAPHLYKNIVDWFCNTLDLNIKNGIEQFNSKSLTIGWRLVKLQSAIKYREAGQFPVSDKELEQIIEEQISILSQEK